MLLYGKVGNSRRRRHGPSIQSAWNLRASEAIYPMARWMIASGSILILRVRVQRIHELTQDYVHLPNRKGELVPLSHCQRKDNPKKRKSDLPRASLSQASVLCRGLLQHLGLACQGRKNKLGRLGGPRNDCALNRTRPALSTMPFSETIFRCAIALSFSHNSGNPQVDNDALCSEDCT